MYSDEVRTQVILGYENKRIWSGGEMKIMKCSWN